MTVLSDSAIEELIASGDLQIVPLIKSLDKSAGNTVDLRLGMQFIIMKRGSLAALTFDHKHRNSPEELFGKFYDRVFVGLHRPFVLHPQELVLGATFEYLRLPTTIYGEVTARSSLGRLGLIIATATAVHPGFKGCLTLELVNHGNIPIQLFPGTPIAQIVFHSVQGTQTNYKGRYSGFAGPTGPEWSKIHQGDEIWRWIPK